MSPENRLIEGAPEAVSGDELRSAMGRFATGVTIITSRKQDGTPVGTTVSAVSSLSLDPPLVLVCLAHSSATLATVRTSGAFGVNILAAHQSGLSDACARPSDDEIWESVTHRAGVTDTPRLDDALAHVECVVEHFVSGGDHEIVIGRVVDVELGSSDHQPLLYYRGAYLPGD